ncbi:hypothetical protein SPRG_00167 [Saprolegnia parasitica CBS 223.65]|uniref:Uncharacterized protein n=1 Tax=Saprolegnia parasitica (strain CBS 223.65) TaxID=695850 RepID=A0A067CXV0_SAPPC|nr:hypothetical protein SPRG_00167 [Saprolegnia parasitica CBS 223.65]KDO35318.1 hypothetical protein SPRG_00167 [Saprolegnia parasitica CBS 223.65]|eukprot:XP_012193664.1 hypothetical protein SPRG_00167 [Saprolegnia parasitica CBS 223.65]
MSAKAAKTTTTTPAAEAAPADDMFTINFDSDDEEEDEEDEEEEEDEAAEPSAKRARKDADKPVRQVIVPRDPTLKKLDAITTAIMKATGNDDDGGFSMFNTSSSYPMQMVLKKEMAVARKMLKEGKHSQALCVLIAIFMNMERYDYWFSDSDDSRMVETTFTSFYKLVQDALKKDDATLRLTGRDVLVEKMAKLGRAAKESFDYEFKWFD